MNFHKLFSFFLIFLLLANLVLFAIGKVGFYLFWGIIAIGALIAFKISPQWGKHIKKR